jgi:hypothetical protein
MWSLEPTTQWNKDRKWYEKKHPDELAAVLENLDRYHQQLNLAPNPRVVQAGYLHPEPCGVVAVDQKGHGSNLQQTRLYTFADPETKTLHLITIGDKRSQSEDIKLSKAFAKDLQKDP